MSKKIVIFSVTMLSVLFLTSCFSKDEGTTTSNSSTSAVETSAPAPDVAQIAVVNEPVVLGPGFVEYDESVIGEVENTVLFFHQESCGTCKATEADLIENGLPVDTQVLKIDIDADSSTDLKKKYGVTMKHTFVQVDANGEMIKKWSGSMSGDDIIAQVEGTGYEVPEVSLEGIDGFADYTPSMIRKRDNVVLFFHQESCGTCKATEKSLIENPIPEDLQVLKIDIDADSATELKKQYGVTMKHTFVQIDNEGNMIKKWSGSADVNDIVEQIGGEVMMKEDKKVMEKEDTATTETVPATKELSGVYADYDASLVGKTDDTVIAFFAGWCPSCVAADKGISGGTVPDGLSILKTDFDSSTDLRKKYGVTSQHTYVQVDASGEMIKKWSGGNTVESIVEKVQ